MDHPIAVTTKYVLLGVTFALIAYDVVVACVHLESTISRLMLQWSMRQPKLPMLAGFLCAHLFCSSCGITAIDVWRDQLHVWFAQAPAALFGTALLILVIPWPAMPGVMFVTGLAVGYLIWPQ